MTKQESKWIKFYPSLDLPKDRVSIAYDTNDERGVRYAYGHFQFYNGTCGCFWKDGNEQPKVVKAEDIKYWMPVPSLDVQEEPVSEQNLSNVERIGKNWKEESDLNWKDMSLQEKKDLLASLQKDIEPASEDLEKAANQIVNKAIPPLAAKYKDGAYVGGIRDYFDRKEFVDLVKAGAHWQKEKVSSIVKQYAVKGENNYQDSIGEMTYNYWDGFRDCANGIKRELED